MIPKKIIINKDNEEIVQPILQSFPLKYIRQEFSINTYQFVDWHWHAALQYCYIVRGRVSFQVGKCQETFQEGDGLFINSLQVHTSVPEHPNDCYICLNVSPYLLGDEGSSVYHQFALPLLDNPQAAFLAFHRQDEKNTGMLAAIRMCMEKAETGREHYDLELFSDLVQLWNETLKLAPKCADNVEEHRKENKRLQDILFYLNLNYKEPVSLQDVAAHVHISRSECSRFFREMTGQNLFAYLTQLRIQKSVEYLLDTDVSVTEIAAETGFGSQSYFTQKFRAVKGISPREFRAKHKKESTTS